MTYIDALILGIVEGLTEFLPVSSTGHLILTNSLLGLEGRTADSFTIVIQLGAILAVLALYKDRAREMIEGLLGKSKSGLDLFLKLLTAFIPAVILGLTFEDYIDKYLFNPVAVALALVVGGIFMIIVEKLYLKRDKEHLSDGKSIAELTFFDALFIGFAQCFALWPGTSRSMSTIIGAQLRGYSNRDAAELSFLLALPTLGGATVYKLFKDRDQFLEMDGGFPLIVFGNLIAFVVAFVAVKWFVQFLNHHGMTPFGVYRILIGLLFLFLAMSGMIQF